MAKDKKVISLEERRRGASHRPGQAAGTPRNDGQAQGDGGAPDSDGASGRPGQIAIAPAPTTPLPGRLIWLYCPTCRSIEYTELDMAGGRLHNVCGTQVQEFPVELDLRAEATIAHINLERLSILESLLAGQRERYEEYLRRLRLAAGKSLEPYAVAEETVSQLPVADVDAFGLLVSRFFHNPTAHFPELAVKPGAAAPPNDPEE
jgi:hypothetical protein